MKRDEWLTNRVAYLKNLKARTEHQQLLVLLAEKPDRSAADNQLLAALVGVDQAVVSPAAISITAMAPWRSRPNCSGLDEAA